MSKTSRAFKKIGRFFTSKEYKYKKTRRTVMGTVSVVCALVAIVAVLLMLFGGKGKPYHKIDYMNTIKLNGSRVDFSESKYMLDNLEFLEYSMRTQNYDGNKATDHTVYTLSKEPLSVVETLYNSKTGFTDTVVTKGVKISTDTDNNTDSAPNEDEIIKRLNAAKPQELLGKYFENKSLGCYSFDGRMFLVGTVDNVDIYICSVEGGTGIESATIRDNTNNKTVIYKFNYYK